MRTASVQNSTSSLPDNSIQTGANAGAAGSLLVALDFHELVAASLDFGPAPKRASETIPSKSSESEDSSVAQSAAASYLVPGLQATPAQAAPLKIQMNQAATFLAPAAGAFRAGAQFVPAETQGSGDSMTLLTRAAVYPTVNLPCPSPSPEAAAQSSTGSSEAAISTSSDSSRNPNSNQDAPLQIPAQLFSSALFASYITAGPTLSRFQESTQSLNSPIAELTPPTALDATQRWKNSTTERSTSSSPTTSGQSGYGSVQSFAIDLLQPVDPVPIRPVPSDSSLANSAEPAQSPRFSSMERQLADRNSAGSDDTEIFTSRDDTASADPIAFEAKISSVMAAGNFSQSIVPHPNSQGDRVESVDGEHVAAELRPEDLSTSTSTAMASISGTPSGDTKRPATTAPQTPVTAQLDPLLESERPAESNQVISVNLSSTADGPVNVRFVERSGEVHVTVRTADPALAQDFRSGLSDLSGRLEHAGFRAEVSSHAGTDPNLRRDSEQASPDSRNPGRQDPQSRRDTPQRDPNEARPDRRNPHTSKFAASVNNLLKEQNA